MLRCSLQSLQHSGIHDVGDVDTVDIEAGLDARDRELQAGRLASPQASTRLFELGVVCPGTGYRVEVIDTKETVGVKPQRDQIVIEGDLPIAALALQERACKGISRAAATSHNDLGVMAEKLGDWAAAVAGYGGKPINLLVVMPLALIEILRATP